MERLVEIEKVSYEENVEQNKLRPTIWNQYIGQEHIKENLQISIQASKIREDYLDHILLYGPPGLGKTTLASIISNQMEANIKIIAAPSIEKSGDLAAILTNIEEGDILFIDEIHRLSPTLEEILYPAMEDFRLDIIIGSGPAAQTVKIDLEKFTLIGATTRAGMISNPLRDRFGMQFRMQFYTEDELAKIVTQASKKLNKPSCDEASQQIASRSRGTPRIALRLLKRIVDYAEVENEIEISIQRAMYALEKLGIDENGFDDVDKNLLELLVQNKDNPIGISTIAATLSEDIGTIEYIIEPYLIANGYIQKTARGRIATSKSFELIKKAKSY